MRKPKEALHGCTNGRPFPWRMDDSQVAFPIYEKVQELGVNLIGVHKGVPLGPQPIEATQTWDMDGAAANFPDINFVIFHVGLPFIDETCWQLLRYPNLYASIAATIKPVAPLRHGHRGDKKKTRRCGIATDQRTAGTLPFEVWQVTACHTLVP